MCNTFLIDILSHSFFKRKTNASSVVVKKMLCVWLLHTSMRLLRAWNAFTKSNSIVQSRAVTLVMACCHVYQSFLH